MANPGRGKIINESEKLNVKCPQRIPVRVGKCKRVCEVGQWLVLFHSVPVVSRHHLCFLSFPLFETTARMILPI